MKSFITRHKIISSLFVLLIAGGTYYAYGAINGTSTVTRYIAVAAQKGIVTVSVSGSGQVSVSHQTDVKAKVSGDATYVGVKNGQSVRAGATLVQFDSREANNAVRDAKINLESAELTLEKLKRGTRKEEISLAESKVESAKKDVTNAETNLETVKKKAETDLAGVYDDTRNILQDAYNKADDALNRQTDDLFVLVPAVDLTFLTTDSQKRSDAIAQRVIVGDNLKRLKEILDNFKPNDPDFDNKLQKTNEYLTQIQTFFVDLTKVVDSATAISQTTVNTYLGYVSTARNNLNTALTNVNNQLQAVTNQKSTNDSNIVSAEGKVDSAKNTLLGLEDDLIVKRAGTDELDIEAQELTIKQRKNSLHDAEEKLADYSARAPFNGTVAKVSVKKGDEISSGTVVATLITNQRTAEISLNEVDAAKVRISQKATLTFDAIDGLTIDGKVADLDTIGTVTQGVVTYNSQIIFDTQDARVKPGMSVSATIDVEEKKDVLAVQNAAVKTQGKRQYVEIAQSADTTISPRRQPVEVGISNDTLTEITSGLNEGEMVVIRTLNSPTNGTQATNGGSLFRIPGMGGSNRSGGGSSSSRPPEPPPGAMLFH